MKESKSHGYKTKDMVQQQEMVQQRPVLTKASPLTEEQARALKSLYATIGSNESGEGKGRFFTQTQNL